MRIYLHKYVIILLISLIKISNAQSQTASPLIISEFRLRGTGGANDEFIEIYNPTAFDHTVISISGTGYGIASSDGITRASIPNGTVIKPKQHYLIVGSAYSLANYGGTSAAVGNTNYASDIPDNMGIAIFNNNTGDDSYTLANRLDAVGSATEANTLYKEGTGYPVLGTMNLQSAIRRKTYNSVPQDSDNNVIDFELVEPNGTTNGSPHRKGAPGPENMNSPVARNSNVIITRIDQTVGPLAEPNVYRNPTPQGTIAPLGTIEFRYRITNNTGMNLTRVRLRLDSLIAPVGSGNAELWAITSSPITVFPVNDPVNCELPFSPPCTITVLETTIESPPAQPNGGGINSSWSSNITTANYFPAGASMNIRVVFGVHQKGDYHLSFTPEVLPYAAAVGPVPPPEMISGFTDPVNVTINQSSGQSDPATSGPINYTVVFSEAITTFSSSDVTLSGTAGATTAVVTEVAPNNGTTYNVAVSGMNTSGTVIASIPADAAFNSINIGNSASTSADNTVTYSLPLSVTVNQAASQSDPTSDSPIHFTVTFNQAVTGFTSSDISFTGSSAFIFLIPNVTVTGGPIVYDVAVSGMTSSGTVIATVPAGSALNAASQSNSASTSTDNSVVYNIPPCSIICPSNINVAATSPSGAVVNYSVTPAGDCQNIVRVPVSGTTFPVGTTTVNAYNNVSTGLVYGLSHSTDFLTGFPIDELVTFNVNTAGPTTLSTPITITGASLPMVAIDFRPSNGQLYGLEVAWFSTYYGGKIYTINKNTGVATALTLDYFDLSDAGSFDIDFDPVTDILRVTDGKGANLRIDPDLGTVIASDPALSAGITATAYSNTFASSTFTTLYEINSVTNALYIQGGINGVPSPNTGSSTLVGPLGIDVEGNFTGVGGFDISLSAGALATFVVDGVYKLYSINLSTGTATLIGTFNGSVIDIAIAPVTLPATSCSFTVTVTPPAPTVTINKASTQADPTSNVPINFTVVFDQDVTGFDASDISFAGSTAPGTLVATISGTGPTYDVSVIGITGSGDVVASINAGAVQNNSGQANLASTSTDNVVQVIATSHDLTIIKAAPLTVAAGNVLTYSIAVSNNSSSTILNITVNDLLPSGLLFHSLSVPTNIPGLIGVGVQATPAVGQNGLVSIHLLGLQPGATAFCYLQVTVDPNLTGSFSNTATVTGPLGDTDPSNNTSTAITQILEPPQITCPGNILLNADPGKCDAVVSFTGENEIVVTGASYTASYTVLFENGGQSGSGIPGTIYFPIGVNTVNITAANDAGSSSCSFTVTVVDNQPPVINCPSDIIVNAQAGQCSADVSITISGSDNCMSDRGLTVASPVLNTFIQYPGISTFSASQIRNFPVGTATINVLATDAAGNTATCSFNITVLDIEKPVITSKPADLTVECTSQIPAVNIASVSASDNCGTPTITHVDDVISDQTCTNKYTVTRTYRATDGSGNTATAIQLITVDDKTPPTITGLTPSKRVLAPPNHKMVDITLAYTINDNCVSSPNVTINIGSNEPENGTGDGDTNTDWEIIDDHHIRLRAERAGQGTGRIYTITVTVNDGCNDPVSATTEVMVVHNITGPHSGNSFKVGSTVAFTGEFWDVPGNKHTAKWAIDGASVSGVVTEPVGSKNGKVTGSYKFTTPGVYKLQMNVTDQKGVTTYANTNGDLEAIVVIYDPNGGYTYGGGYYNSPAGALVSNPSSTGKASYGFAMNYFKSSTNPKGEKQFEFKVGDFEFNALNFDYLVISNSMAQFKGTGKIIGGQSGVAFTMTVTDGQLDGSGIDKIRMKIYNKNNGKIIYDNQPGASDAALPTQAVGANSIVVISGFNSSLTSANTSQKTEMEATGMKAVNGLDVIAYPNPTTNNFSITVEAAAKDKIMMQVVDMYGRVIETRNVSANSIIRFGDRYRAGTYFVRIIQGKEHKELKLVKLSD